MISGSLFSPFFVREQFLQRLDIFRKLDDNTAIESGCAAFFCELNFYRLLASYQ